VGDGRARIRRRQGGAWTPHGETYPINGEGLSVGELAGARGSPPRTWRLTADRQRGDFGSITNGVNSATWTNCCRCPLRPAPSGLAEPRYALAHRVQHLRLRYAAHAPAVTSSSHMRNTARCDGGRQPRTVWALLMRSVRNSTSKRAESRGPLSGAVGVPWASQRLFGVR
jgi:hypothetical protein